MNVTEIDNLIAGHRKCLAILYTERSAVGRSNVNPWLISRHKTVIDAVCAEFKMRDRVLLGKRRQRCVSWPRALAASIMVTTLDMSAVQTGKYLNKDHTSILSAVKRIPEIELENPDFAAAADRVRAVVDEVLK